MSATKTKVTDAMFLDGAQKKSKEMLYNQLKLAEAEGRAASFDPQPILFFKTEEGEIVWTHPPLLGDETKNEVMTMIGGILAENNATAAHLTMIGWGVKADDDIDGMRISHNPRRRENIISFGVSREGLGGSHSSWLKRSDDRLDVEGGTDCDGCAGMLVAYLLAGVDADLSSEQLADIAAGELVWPSLERPRQPRTVETTPGRNEPCDCGSGKKAKKCCHN